MKRAILIGVAVVMGLVGGLARAHPDVVEPGLLSHWAVGSAGGHDVEGQVVEDVTHGLKARVMGASRVIVNGPAQGWWMDGATNFLMIAEDYRKALKHLPKQEMTVSAWVSYQRQPDGDGGIVGAMYDTGSREAGWVLGTKGKKFSFALASKGANDGNGNMTYLAGGPEIEKGKWYFVAGTYDGQVMRLYVNGMLAGESKEQSGEILYPEAVGAKASYVLGAYLDDNEKLLMEGVLHRVKTYSRVLSGEELTATAAKNQNMVDFDPATSSQLSFLVSPYLQFGTQTSMVVMSEASGPSKMVVQYGRQQPMEMVMESSGSEAIETVRIEGLEPQTTYFYRVLRVGAGGEFLASPVMSFQTAVKDDMPWALGVIGDTQRNPEVTRRCAEGLYGLRPNMIIHCGDVVDDGFAKNQWVKDLFEPMSKLLGHVPMFPVIGNHENDAHFYYDYFNLPKPEYWYTFTYGNAQFFMVDTNRDTKPGSEQYKWLEAELAKSTATWKFAVHHHPCWSSDEDDYGDKIRGDASKRKVGNGDPAAIPLIELYEKYKLDIGFAGHIHSYERTWPIYQMNINLKDGVRYIVSGGGGGGLEQAAPNRTWFQKHVKQAHHYCFMTVHGKSIQFFAYDEDGRLFDTFELEKP